MDEKRLLERIQASAQEIQVPDSLKPEEIEKKLKEKNRETDRTGKKRTGNFRKKGLLSAAAVLLCVGIVAAAGKYLRSGTEKAESLASKASVHEMADAAAPESAESAFGDTEVLPVESLYAPAGDYGKIYDLLEREEAQKEEVSYEGAVGDEPETSAQAVSAGEGDRVKTDGEYIYLLNGCEVNLVDIRSGEMKLASKLSLTDFGPSARALELYVEGDLLHVVVEVRTELSETSADQYGAESREQTGLLTYDISDRTVPVLKGAVFQSGVYQASRKAGAYVYLFTKQYLELPEGERSVCIQKESVCEWLPVINHQAMDAEHCYISESGGQSSWVISAINQEKPETAEDAKVILGNSSAVYISDKSMILQEINQKHTKNATNLVKFSFCNGKIEAESAAAIKGTIRDEYSIHEQGEYLRIFTTSADEQTGQDQNNLYILQEDLSLAGCLEGMAAGESVYSVRFMENIGYFATYRNSESLFSVDLSDPYHPNVIGSQKVTGFSEYLQFWGENQMLGIGCETDPETGEVKGIRLSMYDISNPADIKETAQYVLEEIDYTPALYRPECVLVQPERGIIGLAGDTYGDTDWGACYQVFSYTPEQGFRREMKEKLPEKYYGAGEEVRGMYSENTFYLVSPDEITSYRTEKGYEKINTLTLEN